MPKKVFKFGKKTATVSSVPVETYGEFFFMMFPNKNK